MLGRRAFAALLPASNAAVRRVGSRAFSPSSSLTHKTHHLTGSKCPFRVANLAQFRHRLNHLNQLLRIFKLGSGKVGGDNIPFITLLSPFGTVLRLKMRINVQGMLHNSDEVT